MKTAGGISEVVRSVEEVEEIFGQKTRLEVL